MIILKSYNSCICEKFTSIKKAKEFVESILKYNSDFQYEIAYNNSKTGEYRVIEKIKR